MRLDHCGTWFYIHTIILSQKQLFSRNYRSMLQLSPSYIYAQAAQECSLLTGELFNDIVGSPYYMAPEVLKQTEQGVAQAIIRSAIDFKRDPWPKVSGNAKDLVKKMLNPDPKERLTIQEVLEHPWLQNAKKVLNVPLGETVKARLKQFSIMNKLNKRALRGNERMILK
ncbi:hypothetical protein PVK06_048514 [Gossypium arboreum]|uniref:Protein kinase domain-containing protein n=1 Tax=Gossypium arboreum TaxID=29729 RepID=A0ABR0MIU4_GOSAR|nr:hypothetical protein PVK06_048514 [Gossypium arboreum]